MATETATFKGDPFAELGISPTATHDEVRRAFRRRARETHPDHQPNDPHAARRFARLRAAYEEALVRLKNREQGERRRSTFAPPEQPKRKAITEYELATRVHGLSDATTLRRILARHGHRTLIAAALARNPAFPTDALLDLRLLTEGHWTVDTVIASRADVSAEMLFEIARLAREPSVGLAVVGNARTDTAILDALVQGPIRLDVPLENALADHPDLSVQAAARLASRHATHIGAVLRLIDRGDLPEELVRRLASQSSRPMVAATARNDLLRRGLPVPPDRTINRHGRSMPNLFH